jgi:hypothetical protein
MIAWGFFAHLFYYTAEPMFIYAHKILIGAKTSNFALAAGLASNKQLSH